MTAKKKPAAVESDVDHSPSVDVEDSESILAWLTGRELTDEQKATINTSLDAMEDNDDVMLPYLQGVMNLLVLGQEPQPWNPPPDDPEIVDTPDPTVAAGNDDEVLTDDFDAFDEEEHDDGDQDETLGAGAAGDQEGMAGSPTPGGAEDRQSGDADAPDGEAGAWDNYSYSELVEAIRVEAGGATVDALDQRVAWLDEAETLPYLRECYQAVLDQRDLPPLDADLGAKAQVNAAKAARDRRAIVETDEEVGVRRAEPPPPPPLGDEEVAGFRTGQPVRCLPESKGSIYYGHIGYIEDIYLTDAQPQDPTALVRFHRVDEEPGERVPAVFPLSQLAAIAK